MEICKIHNLRILHRSLHVLGFQIDVPELGRAHWQTLRELGKQCLVVGSRQSFQNKRPLSAERSTAT